MNLKIRNSINKLKILRIKREAYIKRKVDKIGMEYMKHG